MGRSGDFSNERFTDALKIIDKICKKRKVTKGIHLPKIDNNSFKDLIKNNFRFIAYGMDTQFLIDSIKNSFKKI